MYNNITKLIGFSIIILACLNIFNVVDLSPIYVMGFSMAAASFSLIEFLEFKAEEENDSFKFTKIKWGLFFLAVLSFMVIPELSFGWSDVVIVKISEFATLLSIGIVFVILGLKQEKVASEKLKQIMDQKIQEILPNIIKDEVQKKTDELLKNGYIKKEAIKAMDEINKQQNTKKNS
ncbi:hypothetical protein [Sporosarcina psychrophila]|uniref:hypothetical protein n=1 Tax=Sporosarcina psychrophila TaxID=1476 RepID=UPI00078E36EA|nr:hypothetical protein [Sporosarcina psychrophila]AMQ05905.1 hypothetical protein AZE41_08235 [Sporosarcina psychrophila]